MGEAAPIIRNYATGFGLGVLLDAGEPANDTKTPVEVPRYKWIHCANEGEYRGHHQGPFTFTREVFEAFVRNFRASPQYQQGELELGGQKQTLGTAPVIQFDYEHASEMAPWEGSIPKTGCPAAGWVIEVAIRNDADGKAQLWALGELDDDIRGYIAARKYRWVSIAFALEGVHWITGKPIGPVLTSIAWTNHPFMADLEPLAAANRATSQPDSTAVRSPSYPTEAPDGTKDLSRPGATMKVETRERICRALKIQTLADDEQVAGAVEQAAGSGSKLSALVTALGEVDYDAAIKAVPALRDARDKATELLSEINALLGATQAQDAIQAPQDVAAVMSASKMSGTGPQNALATHRQWLIDQEIERVQRELAAKAKPGETPRVKLADLVAAIKAGREKFFAEHGISMPTTPTTAASAPAQPPTQTHPGMAAVLGASLCAGPNGLQLSPPRTVPGIPLTMQQSNGAAETYDLRGVEGPNPVLRMVELLRKNEAGFVKLPWHRQVERAELLTRTANVLQ